MPIGKNAIKRVENNGYSKVASSAHDMENSEVVEKVEKVVEPVPAPFVSLSEGISFTSNMPACVHSESILFM